MRRTLFGTALPARFIVLTFAFLLYIIASTSDVSYELVFSILSALLLFYLAAEISNVRASDPRAFWLNPVVFCSIFTFAVGFGATNFIFILYPEDVYMLGVDPEVTYSMVKTLWLALMACMAMWMGYSSNFIRSIVDTGVANRFQRRFLPGSNNLRSLALPALIIIACAARLAQINLGIFGYAASPDLLIDSQAFGQYLTLLGGLGKLSLVLVALRFYSNESNWAVTIYFILILFIETIFGVLSGFKTAVILPFIIVGICKYLRTGAFPSKWATLAITGLFIAYGVVEPYRASRNVDVGSVDASPGAIINRVINSAFTNIGEATDDVPLILTITSRLNVTNVGAVGVEFKDSNNQLPPGSPEFLKNIILAPFHAWIPRFVYSDKPLGDLGKWYTQVVFGKDFNTSTGMGPITYLYFAGGISAVIIGFFVIGVIQHLLFYLLRPQTSDPGAVIYLTQLTTISFIDSSINGIVINLAREIPLLIIICAVCFRTKNEK